MKKTLLIAVMFIAMTTATAQASTWDRINEDIRWLLDNGYVISDTNFNSGFVYTALTKAGRLSETKYVRCIEQLDGRFLPKTEYCSMLISTEEVEKR